MEFMYSAKPADTELKAPARQLQQLSETGGNHKNLAETA